MNTITVRIYRTDGTIDVEQIDNNRRKELLADPSVAAVEIETNLSPTHMVTKLRRNARYDTPDGMIYDARGEVIASSGKGKRPSWIQEKINKGEVFYKDANDMLTPFEYTGPDLNELTSILYLATARAALANTVALLDRKSPNESEILYEMNNPTLMLALRNWRESASVFLFPMQALYEKTRSALTDELELKAGRWMERNCFMQKPEFDLVNGNDIRRFEKSDGEIAQQDDLGKGPIDNGTTLYYPNEEVLKAAQADNDNYWETALDFFCTLDSVKRAGEECGFKENEITRAVVQTFYEGKEGNTYTADKITDSRQSQTLNARMTLILWEIIEILYQMNKLEGDDVDLSAKWDDAQEMQSAVDQNRAVASCLDKLFRYIELPEYTKYLASGDPSKETPAGSGVFYTTFDEVSKAALDNNNAAVNLMNNWQTTIVSNMIGAINTRLMKIFPFWQKTDNGAVIEEYALKAQELRKTGFIKSKDEFVQYVSNGPVMDMTEETDTHGENRDGSGDVAPRATEGKMVTIEQTRCADDKTCEFVMGEPLKVYMKAFTPSLPLNKEMTDIGEDIGGTTKRAKVYMVHADRVRKAYQAFTQAIKFKDTMTPKVIFSTMLVKNGALILKGVAGTGKTTMIECLTMLMCNDIDYQTTVAKGNHPDGRMNSNNTLDTLKNPLYGTVGIAKHNPDKMPDEIYYYTKITRDYYSKSQFEKYQKGGARRNPYGSTTEELEKFYAEVTPESSEAMVFKPLPRPVVTHPIKFHNEGNRMNKRVADATLGLLAENEMEFQGETFPSPPSFTLLDYNPHIDWQPDGEMDRALLDRFDASVFIPALNLGNKVALLLSSAAKGASPRKLVQNYINAGVTNPDVGVDPLSYDELSECWRDVGWVSVPERTLFLAGCYSNTFSMSFRKYDYGADGYYKEVEQVFSESIIKDDEKVIGSKKASDVQIKAATAPFMDSSVENFGFGPEDDDNITDYFSNKGIEASDAISTKYSDKAMEGTMPSGFIARMTQNYRPLGFRNADSLIRLAKAYTWLTNALDDETSVQEKGLTVSESALVELLPYVIGHRLNLGVGDSIKQTYANVEDWVKNDVIDQYIGVSEGIWLKIFDNTKRTLFTDLAEDGSRGMAYDAFDGKMNIDRQSFYERFDKMMTAPGYLSDAAVYWTSVAADPIAYECREYAYEHAKTLSAQPTGAYDSKKGYEFQNGFAYNKNSEYIWEE